MNNDKFYSVLTIIGIGLCCFCLYMIIILTDRIHTLHEPKPIVNTKVYDSLEGYTKEYLDSVKQHTRATAKANLWILEKERKFKEK